jgi:O-antigen ligase
VALIYGGRSLVEGSGSFEYVVNKAVRLFDGINTAGLVSGDETGRGERFELSAQTFLRHPVFGVGYEEAGRLVGGHSSFVDSWARYGIVGYLPCFLFQVFLTRRVVSNWARGRRDFVAFGSLVCWAIFWVGGILNPVVNSVLPPLLLFTDCWLEKGVRPTGRPGGRENGGKSGFKQKVEKRFR